MRDFINFSKWFFRLYWILKGVIGALLAQMLIVALILDHVEHISFGNAIYLALITAFTIGYGDFTPNTVLGKVLCVFEGYVGVIFMGLTVAIATIALKEIARKYERHFHKDDEK